ncbi:MAG: Ig-like domain-containing protein, partial [Thermoplasmata archaeon]
VELGTSIVLEFSEPIEIESLRTGLVIRNSEFYWDRGEDPGHFSIEDFGPLSLAESTLTIHMPPLEYDERYEVTLSGNTSHGIMDLGGNPLDGNGNGISEGSPDDDLVISFSTSDPTPPRVVFTEPYAGEEGIALRSPIRAVFDDEMNPLTLDSFNISLLDNRGHHLEIELWYYMANRTLLIVPANELNYSTTYLVVISSEVRDTSQNRLDGNGDGIGGGPYDDFSWNFTSISDTVPPSLEILYPEDDDAFTIGDVVNITGYAMDLAGIAGLELRIRNQNWTDILHSFNETDNSWFYEWDTGDYEEGQYRIQVRAYDMSGRLSIVEVVIQLRKAAEPFPIWIVVLVTAVLLAFATIGYRYTKSRHAEKEKIAELRKAEMEEMLRRLEEEHQALAERAKEIEAKELDLETREKYLKDLDAHYQSLAQSLFERERIDFSTGERIVAQEMGESLYEIKRYEKAFTLLSEAEASQAGELTERLPESGKKALLLVYFNALEAYLREKLRGLIPEGATILLGEKGHINTRSKGWEEKWSTLSLGILVHAIDHNKHFFVKDEALWKDTKGLMREIVDIRNLTAHPSEANPELSDVRGKVYTAIRSLSDVLRRPRAMKR